jgi:hypothetical protein
VKTISHFSSQKFFVKEKSIKKKILKKIPPKKCTEKLARGVVLKYPCIKCILKRVGVQTSSSRSL